MIAYPPSLAAVGGARTGIAPVNLLDVQDVNGNLYFWSDRRIIAPSTVLNAQGVPALPPVAIPAGQSVAWALPRSVNSGYIPGGGTAVANLSSAELTLTQAHSLNQLVPESYALWSNFKPLSLPDGAVITAIYPVLIVNSPAILPGSAHMVSGTGLVINDAVHHEDGPFMNQCSGAAGVLGEFYGTSLGTDLSDLTTGEIIAYMWTSVTGNYTDAMQVTFIGAAIYYSLPSPLSGGITTLPAGSAFYQPWLLTVPELTFHRSSVADLGSFVLQNLSGDTISRDFEKIMRRSALEGAFCVFRSWQPDAQASWIEVHGKLTVEDVGVDTVTLKGEPAINPAQDDTPLEEFAEGCQLAWGQARCGATGATECQYSFQSCQVIERIMAAPNSFEKNYGEAVANVPTQLINRRRRI